MPFKFVDNSNIDRGTRKLIRSHVAKGKNVGKTIQRRKRSDLISKDVSLSYRKQIDANTRRLEIDSTTPVLERPVNSGLCALSCPSEMNTGSWSIIQDAFSFIMWSLFTPELSDVIDFGRHKWVFLQNAVIDEAFFHCITALSLCALHSLSEMGKVSPQEVHHLSRTMQLLNQRLSETGAVPDRTIVITLAMTQYERIRGQYRRGLVHFEAVCRMVDLRGGILSILNDHPALARKIFRADLEFALCLGIPIRYSVDDIPSSRNMSWLQGENRLDTRHSFCNSKLFKTLGFSTQEIIVDIMSLTRALNSSTTDSKTKFDEHVFHDTLILIGYRLAQTGPLLELQPDLCMEDALLLNLVVFMSTFILGLGRKNLDDSLLSRLAHRALQRDFDIDKESQELFIWMIFLLNTSLPLQLDDIWMEVMVRDKLIDLGLYTWEDVKSILNQYPWVGVLHDKRGEEFWHRLMPCLFITP